MGSEPPPFERWYLEQRRKPISRLLLTRYFEQAIPALQRLSAVQRLPFLETRLAELHFVGSYRTTDEMIAGLSRELGISETVTSQHVTPRRKPLAADLPDPLRRQIEEENALDQALFDRGSGRGWHGTQDAPKPRESFKDHQRYLLGDISTDIIKRSITWSLRQRSACCL